MAVTPAIGVSASGWSPYQNDKANGVVQGVLPDAAGAARPFAFWGPINVFVWGEYNTSLTVTAGDLTAQVADPGPLAAGQAVNSVLVPYGTTIGAFADPDAELVLPTYTIYGQLIYQGGVWKITELASTDFLLGASVNGSYPGKPLTGGVVGATVASIEQEAVAPSIYGSGQKGIVVLAGGTISHLPENASYPFDFGLVAGGLASGVDADALFTGAAIGATAGTVQLERSFDGGRTFIPCNVGAGALAQFSLITPLSFSFGEPENGMLYRLNVLEVTPTTDVAVNYRISATGQASISLSVPTI